MDNKIFLYSVRDKVAEKYGPIFEAVNDAVALRNFRQMMLKITNGFRADYELYKLAEYDMMKGVIDSEYPPKLIETGGENLVIAADGFLHTQKDAKKIQQIIEE